MKREIPTKLHGKDKLTMAGEYTSSVLLNGIRSFAEIYFPALLVEDKHRKPTGPLKPESPAMSALASQLSPRPPSFCTGCPERPIFTAMKLVEHELGQHHVSADIGCHLFSILPPFNIGATTMGYGLGAAGAAAFNTQETSKRTISIMGDGGFWHNGLTSGVGNAVFNQNDNVLVVIDNAYTAATGGQDILSSKAENPIRTTKLSIAEAVKGVGVKWARTLTRTYDVEGMRHTLHEALTTKERGPKVIVAQTECTLNRERREKPYRRKLMKEGKRVEEQKFGVDPETCTGDHSCIRLSGCPSLSIAPNPDPLRKDPVATVLTSCVGCGLCGEVAHAARLCPSFYRTTVVNNPGRLERIRHGISARIIAYFQRRAERRLQAFYA